MSNVNSSGYDDNINAKIAGTIVFALVVVFVLQQTGFRFVVSASAGVRR